ncbi:MAG: glycosyltransferase [Planctomycetes bacterium]|nr:glycosyltransferase [Planctomycetota bacterium]
MPKISVVIAAYNNGKFLPEVLESIFSQTEKNFEIIVVDDASEDNTQEIMQQYRNRVVYVRLAANGGSAIAWNKAIELAKGEYIVLAAADDVWMPDRLELQAKVLDEKPEISLVYGKCITVDEKGNPLKEDIIHKTHPAGKVFLELFSRDNFMPASTVMFRKALLAKSGMLDSAFRLCQDYDFYMRLARYSEAAFVDKVLVKYRKHAGSVTTGKRHNAFAFQRKVIDKIWNLYKADIESGITEGLYHKRLVKQSLKEGRYYLRRKEKSLARESLREGFKYSLFNLSLLFQYLRTMKTIERIGKRIRKFNLKLAFLFLIIVSLIYLAIKLPEPEYLLPFYIGGLALVIFGEIVRVWATGHLEKNKSLTTSGPYGYVKNPMYVGSFIIMLGFNAMAFNPYIHYILALELLSFVFYYVPVKRKTESPRLVEKFGEAYLDYDKKVPDYIPRRFSAYQGENSEKKWTRAVFSENNELHVGFMVLLGAIAVTLRFWIH